MAPRDPSFGSYHAPEASWCTLHVEACSHHNTAANRRGSPRPPHPQARLRPHALVEEHQRAARLAHEPVRRTQLGPSALHHRQFCPLVSILQRVRAAVVVLYSHNTTGQSFAMVARCKARLLSASAHAHGRPAACAELPRCRRVLMQQLLASPPAVLLPPPASTAAPPQRASPNRQWSPGGPAVLSHAAVTFIYKLAMWHVARIGQRRWWN